MPDEHKIISLVYEAKNDMKKSDDLIREYLPFIKKEASRVLSRMCSEQDDELSIAMFAFHEAIQGYEKNRGAFLSYAGLIIRSRIIDYVRKQEKYQGLVYLDEEQGEDNLPLYEKLSDNKDSFAEFDGMDATMREIKELGNALNDFGLSFTDVAENSPKQERTFEACAKTVKYAVEHRELLDELLKTKKLPMQKLTMGTGVERKTLERHRKYILVMLLIQTNGYEIIRGHIKNIFKMKGDIPA